jgi:hypothetical protein
MTGKPGRMAVFRELRFGAPRRPVADVRAANLSGVAEARDDRGPAAPPQQEAVPAIAANKSLARLGNVSI